MCGVRKIPDVKRAARRILVSSGVLVVALVAIAFVAVSPVAGQPSTQLQVVDEAHFSYRLPTDWTVAGSSVSDYPVAFAPVASEFRTNINFVAELFDGDLAGYAAASVAVISQVFGEDAVKSGPDADQTMAGELTMRVVYEALIGVHQVRAVVYFFDAGDTNIVMTAMAGIADDTQWDRMFEEVAHSVELPR